MSNQFPSDPFCQQVSAAPSGLPDTPMPSAPLSEYIPIGVPPMQPPAYLTSLSYRPATPEPARWPTRGLAIAGFILGLVGILLWVIPGLGDIVSVMGLSFSILGWRTSAPRWLPVIGVALCAAALALSIYNSALGGSIFPH